MTPEEEAVINAVLEWRSAELAGSKQLISIPAQRLRTAADALTYACWECNKGGHNCPGCGAHVGHAGVGVCASCSAEISGEYPRDERGALLRSEQDERAQLTAQLRDWAQDTVHEWMRLISLTDENGIEFQARVRWQNDEGECVVETVEHAENLGRFRITVHAQDLGPLPPVGPETDPALAHEMEAEEQGPVWVLRSWRDVVAGDVVRMPGTEVTANITARLRHPSEDPLGRSWHMVAGEKHWDDVLVQPGQVCVSLDGGAPRFMKPELPVEIGLPPAIATAADVLDWEARLTI